MIKIRTCNNINCSTPQSKNKWGNYIPYCSDACKVAGRAAKFKDTYKNKDMVAIAEKRKATVTTRYGVSNVAQLDSVKDKLRITTSATADIRTAKTKETNLKNHGVESTNSLQSVKDKKKAVFLEKYGVDHQLKIPEVAASVAQKNRENAAERLALAAQTKLEVYGDENYNNRNRYKETCLEKFGVENPSQNAEVHEKKVLNGYKSKELILPSGKMVKVQGYEWIGIPILLKTYTENELVIGRINMPEIWYTLAGKKQRYFPDVYVPKENLIVEVKSQFRYDTDLHINLAKMQGCIEQGFNYRFMICDEFNIDCAKIIDHPAL